MTQRFTPGPWHRGALICSHDGRMRLESGGTTLYPIADMQTGWNAVEDAGNAVLVASAPEMFHLLADLLEWESRMGGFQAPAWKRAKKLMTAMRDEFDKIADSVRDARTVFSKNTHKEFIAARDRGEVCEVTEEFAVYWLEVLPPVRVPLPVVFDDGTELVQVWFGFAEGRDNITVFWREKDVDGRQRYYARKTSLVNEVDNRGE